MIYCGWNFTKVLIMNIIIIMMTWWERVVYKTRWWRCGPEAARRLNIIIIVIAIIGKTLDDRTSHQGDTGVPNRRLSFPQQSKVKEDGFKHLMLGNHNLWLDWLAVEEEDSLAEPNNFFHVLVVVVGCVSGWGETFSGVNLGMFMYRLGTHTKASQMSCLLLYLYLPLLFHPPPTIHSNVACVTQERCKSEIKSWT